MDYDANIEAYQRYLNTGLSGAVSVIDGGREGLRDDYVIVDLNKFRGVDDVATVSYLNTFNEASAGRQGIDALSQALRAEVANVQNGRQALHEQGGGLAASEQGVVFLDQASSSYQEIVDYNVQGVKVSDAHDALYKEFIKEHEIAHSMLDLHEAGADYIAANRLLDRFPGQDTVAFLKDLADHRLMAVFRSDDMGANTLSNSYGFGCAEAINYAVSIQRGDSVEMQLATAQIFDAMNDHDAVVSSTERGVDVRPEIAVRDAIKATGADIDGEKYKGFEIQQGAVKVLNSGQFEEGSVEKQVLESVVGAAGRMDEMVLRGGSAPSINANYSASMKFEF